MPGSILGTRVLRIEDPDLLKGLGQFVGNIDVPALAHAVFVRSPLPHAVIENVEVSEAERAPGVVKVLTADSIGIEPFHGFMVLNEKCARPPLASKKVRFVGEPVAVVIAQSFSQAVDAAEQVVVDYTPLKAVVDPEDALGPDAPLQFDELGSNLAAGTKDSGDRDPFAGATHVTRLRLKNQRVAAVPMEGNAITVIPEPAGSPLVTIYVSTQMPHGLKTNLCRILGLDPESVRVVAPHVGGGFGAKAGVTAEHLVITAAAIQLGRPITWRETRSENMTAMPHGRAQIDYVEIGFDQDALITGMRVRVVSDAGAYAGFGGALAMGPTRLMAQGVYKIPVIQYSVAAALTNTTPMGAFRGAGRPEAAELLERTMNLAASELGIDPVDLRRRNLLSKDSFPMTSVMGARYDSGDYEAALDEALRLSDYAGLRADQQARRDRGEHLLLGIGISMYVEITAGRGSKEFGQVQIHDDGTATISVGTSAHGQGHATSFAMLVSDRLGIPLESIKFVQSDTAAVPRGGGTGGSRSLQLGGNAVLAATDKVLARAKELAASELEANPADIIVTEDGHVGVAGVPASALGWN
ncbi:MAG: xanthine dehydrogenase family protein molybdopterin-binding subunit, partial [Acidimicrobiales bacterium]